MSFALRAQSVIQPLSAWRALRRHQLLAGVAKAPRGTRRSLLARRDLKFQKRHSLQHGKIAHAGFRSAQDGLCQNGDMCRTDRLGQGSDGLFEGRAHDLDHLRRKGRTRKISHPRPPAEGTQRFDICEKMPSDQENARAGVLFQVGVLCPSPGARPVAGGPRGADETQLKLSVNSR